MRITAAIFTLLLLAGLLLPGCSKDQILDAYGTVVSLAGNVGLDTSLTLQGERTFGADKYTGAYTARYEDFTGQECPFGGTALERREGEHVTVTCSLQGDGSARLEWNCGYDTAVILADTAGEASCEETIYLAPGSNYFNLVFEGFTGSVELTIE